MEKRIYEGKEIEEIKRKIQEELQLTENDYFIKYDEEKAGLFKGKKIIAEVITKEDILKEIKSFLNNIFKLMNIEAQLESKIREDQISINIISDNNPILIGKNGKTLDALQIILKQMIQVASNHSMNILLDVEGYKNKKIKNIEFLAKKTAKEVARTKVEAKLNDMNSYERRIVHTVLSESKDVYTESIGEEPNRAVVIKPKDA